MRATKDTGALRRRDMPRAVPETQNVFSEKNTCRTFLRISFYVIDNAASVDLSIPGPSSSGHTDTTSNVKILTRISGGDDVSEALATGSIPRLLLAILSLEFWCKVFSVFGCIEKVEII